MGLSSARTIGNTAVFCPHPSAGPKLKATVSVGSQPQPLFSREWPRGVKNCLIWELTAHRGSPQAMAGTESKMLALCLKEDVM